MNYIKTLLHTRRTVFHTQDLRVLWGISNSNTLYTTIKRYVQRDVLFPVFKGMYTTIPLEQIDPWVLGISATHQYSYISCESILAKAGLLNAIPSAVTLVSSKAKKFSVANHRFVVRQLADQFLFHPYGILIKQDARQATPERALADLLYFNPRTHLDVNVPWDTIRHIQRTVGYPITQRTT